MTENERKLILEKIKNFEDLLANASPGNPDIPRWKQEIENLKARLNF